MKDEIGSFYEIGGVAKSLDEASIPLEAWLEESTNCEGLKLVCSGREAIEAAVIQIEQQDCVERKVCLLPQYTCDTVIIPFQKHGWQIFFYPVDKKMEIKKETLRHFLETINPEVLLIHTYYGVDTAKDVRELIQSWKEITGMIFIEDMTQSLQLLPSCCGADYYVGSLRKWFAVPDGGFVASVHKPIEIELLEEKKTYVEKKLKAQNLKYEYLSENEACEKEVFLKLNREAEDYLYENDSICQVSAFSRNVFEKLDYESNFSRRQENSEYLFEQMRELKKVTPILKTEKGSPLYFPIYVKKREELQTLLRENQIFAPILWPVPEQVEQNMDVDVKYIFENMLALPCDQRYSLKDMKKIVECLRTYDKE